MSFYTIVEKPLNTYLTTKKWNVDINGHTIQKGDAHTILEQSSSTGQVQLVSGDTLQLGKLSTQSLN